MGRAVCCLLTLALIAAACTGDDGTATSVPTTIVGSATTGAVANDRDDTASGLPWWNDRVFYEVFVRSFADSDGDGIGDLPGLTARLDYLNDGDPATTDDLGITGLWLMPIFPSPSYHGYDVTDYRSVNPDYGTMNDFERFLDEAHDRGISVLIDLVINHSSVRHPWFEASAAGDPTYADWYVWADEAPAADVTQPGMDISGLWHRNNGRFYYGYFWEGMPDLDLEQPDVTAELYDIARFWLEDVGVDGFRLDAARHLIEDGNATADTPATMAWLEAFTAEVHSIDPDALVLGEIWTTTDVVSRYVPDAVDLAFEFGLLEAGGEALIAQDGSILTDATDEARTAYPPHQYATFVNNHDMNRLISEVGGDTRPAELAATWLLTGPGVPFVYYGEEVGLSGTKPDERIRTPMPWTDDPPGLGFTTGTPWQPVQPGYQTANVATQDDDPASLLSHYRRLIHARNGHPALRWGETIDVSTSDGSVVAWLRTWDTDHVLVVLNLSNDYATDVSLNLGDTPTVDLADMQGVVPLVGPPALAPDLSTGTFVDYVPVTSLPPYGYLVLHLVPEPSEPPPPTTTTTTPPSSEAGADEIAVVEALIDAFAVGDLEEALALIDPAADVAMADGSVFPLATPLPPEAGFPAEWEWDGDGILTVADIVIGQNLWGSLIVVSSDATCMSDGPDVVCTLVQADVFSDAAGLAPARTVQTFTVSDGVVSAFGEGTTDSDAGRDAAWNEMYAAYERWVSDNHPELFDTVFHLPCCTGTPEGLSFAPASVDAQRTLIPQWVATLS